MTEEQQPKRSGNKPVKRNRAKAQQYKKKLQPILDQLPYGPITLPQSKTALQYYYRSVQSKDYPLLPPPLVTGPITTDPGTLIDHQPPEKEYGYLHPNPTNVIILLILWKVLTQLTEENAVEEAAERAVEAAAEQAMEQATAQAAEMVTGEAVARAMEQPPEDPRPPSWPCPLSASPISLAPSLCDDHKSDSSDSYSPAAAIHNHPITTAIHQHTNTTTMYQQHRTESNTTLTTLGQAYSLEISANAD